MRKLICATVVATLMAAFLAAIVTVQPAAVAAEQKPHHPHRKSAASVAPPRKNPCATYGAGFAPIAGTSTCMKIGGSVSYEAGGSSRR